MKNYRLILSSNRINAILATAGTWIEICINAIVDNGPLRKTNGYSLALATLPRLAVFL